MAIREGRWLCKSCGQECLGRHETCQSCGAPRPAGTRFYLPENSPVVTDPSLLADAQSGQDWYCGHCGGANKGAIDGHPLTNCAHCGEARTSEDKNHGQSVYAAGKQPEHASEATEQEKKGIKPSKESASRPDRSYALLAEGLSEEHTGNKPHLWPWLITITIVFVALALFAGLFVTREVSGVLVDRSWERSVDIEEFKTVQDSGWDLPSDARLHNSYTKVRSYVQVIDRYETVSRLASRQVYDGEESYGCGTRDMGNGYFEDMTCSRSTYRTELFTETSQEPVYRQDPVWDSWHEFEVDRWVVTDVSRAGGNGEDARWPEYTLKEGQRAGARKEEYVIRFVDPAKPDDIIRRKVAHKSWEKADDPRAISFEKNFYGMVKNITIN